MFLDRERELENLKRLARSGRAEFLLLYGRRRVGKSELLDRFIREQGGIRLLAREEAETLQLGRFSGMMAERFQDPLLGKNPLTNWDAFLTYLGEKARRRMIVALDEFPYLVQENKALPSILQAHWDESLRKTRIFLILCGSSIGMMEGLMGARSPLYGRRTGQLLLSPFSFRDALAWFVGLREAVEGYAVFGGTPAYLVEWERKKSLWTNIRGKVLSSDRFLCRDPEFLLREEVREPRWYFSILQSIAKGNTRVGQIMNDTGLEKGVVGKYLGVLCDLHIVEREVPVTEKPDKSRRGIYRVADNYFRFWFRFVFPHLEMVEQGRRDWLVRRVIRPRLNEFVGPVFERVAREALLEMDRSRKLPIRLVKIGRWWEKEYEIDLVGIGEKAHLFCEVKWSDRVDGVRVLRGLREKAKLVGLRGRAHYCVFARSFSQRPTDALTLDLKGLERVFTGG